MINRNRHHRIVSLCLIVALCSVGFFIATSKVRAKDAVQAKAVEQQKVINTANAVQLAKDNATLATLVQTFAAAHPNQVNVVVSDLSDGATASYKADQQVVSASIYKLYVAYGIYKQIDNGTLTLTHPLTGEVAGSTVDDCLNLMITISDNDCGEALGNVLGWSKLDAMLAIEGYTNTRLSNYDKSGNLSGDKLTTANDVALLLTRLYKGTLLNDDTSADFLSYLKADKINTFLPTGLPKGTVIAHKIGELYGYIHDAGIIYSANKDMVVVLLSGEWTAPITQSPPVFAALSSAVWAYQQTP